MELGIERKSAFVTASTAGIGFEISRQLLRAGCLVTINGRTRKTVDEALAKLQEWSSSVTGFIGDLTDPSSMATLPEADILVNNLGGYTASNFYETSDEDWRNLFEVNVMTGVRLSRAYLPQMITRKWGRIIFISSECAHIVPPNLLAYSTTKAALHALSRGLAQLCKGKAITVNTVAPGSTLTEGAQNFLADLAESQGVSAHEAETQFIAKERKDSIISRFLTPTEVASAVVYLCSDLASGVNGTVLKVDGGSTSGLS